MPHVIFVFILTPFCRYKHYRYVVDIKYISNMYEMTLWLKHCSKLYIFNRKCCNFEEIQISHEFIVLIPQVKKS